MRNPHVEDLRKIFRAIQIHSPGQFSFVGQMVSADQGAYAQQAPVPGQQQNPLVGQLQQLLYHNCYCQRFDGRLHPYPAPGGEGDNLVEELSRANTSRERWDHGWQITQVTPSGQVAVHKNGSLRNLWPGEFVTQDGPGVPPRVGGMASLFTARESRTMQAGFYFAFGEATVEQGDLYDAVRFYCNVAGSGAVELTRRVTECLNRFLVPFRFKCCSYRSLFYRLDSAVLYVNKRHYRIAAELLAGIYPQVQPHLRAPVPLFTRRLGAGLAFAEDPGNGESFGTYCCRLVAEGIWSAYMQGSQAEEARLTAVKQQFENLGTSFDRPYLRPGSAYPYEFPAFGE
jgi:hypothetical protein